jgi:tRNA(Ile)-lysidine synthase
MSDIQIDPGTEPTTRLVQDAMRRFVDINVGGPTTIVVGVSGGVDSMSLVHLLDAFCSNYPSSLNIVAVTVDHNLRDSSAHEARSVNEYLASRGITHIIRKWDSPNKSENRARNARYDILFDVCREVNSKYLLLGHHSDDNIETFIMRLSRGSGPDGLAGIPEMRDSGDIRIIRPLLGIEKSKLYEYCRTYNIPWFEDSTNHDESNTRSIIRAKLPELEKLGFRKEALLSTVKQLHDQKAYIDRVMNDILKDACTYYYGCAYLKLNKLRTVDQYILNRIVATVLQKIGGGQYKAAKEKIDKLVLHILSGNNFTKTLSHCIINVDNSHGVVFIKPEKRIMHSLS